MKIFQVKKDSGKVLIIIIILFLITIINIIIFIIFFIVVIIIITDIIIIMISSIIIVMFSKTIFCLVLFCCIEGSYTRRMDCQRYQVQICKGLHEQNTHADHLSNPNGIW